MNVRDYLISAHVSAERGSSAWPWADLGLRPLPAIGTCDLGEGNRRGCSPFI